MTTNYKVNTESGKKDLADIFNPIQNYIDGSYVAVIPQFYGIGTSYDFLGYGGDASSNSFTVINNYLQDDVSTNIIVNVPTHQNPTFHTNLSYLQFNEPGMYKLDLSMKYTSGGYETTNAATLTNVIRLFQSNNPEDQSSNMLTVVRVPTFGAKIIYNLSFSGNSSSTTTSNATSSANDNLSYMFGEEVTDANNTSSYHQGYPVFRPVTTFYGTSIGTLSRPCKNMYNLSVTFKLTQEDINAAIAGQGAYRIFPQIQGSLNRSDNQNTFRIEGNWRVTKLFELSPENQVGSLLAIDSSGNYSGTSYATGFASKNLAMSGQPFTIEMYFRINQETTGQQVLFMLGASTTCPYISYLGTGDPNYPRAIRLYTYGSSYSYSPLVTDPSTVIMFNTWHHLAITCSPSLNEAGRSDWKMYFDGVLQEPYRSLIDSEINTNTNNVTLSNLFLSGNTGLRGNVTNLRLTQKVVYTGNFTVPHVPLQATQSASTNINAINSGECICLVQCYDNSYLKESIMDEDLTANNMTFSESKPSF
jgi:hypothetical protein